MDSDYRSLALDLLHKVLSDAKTWKGGLVLIFENNYYIWKNDRTAANCRFHGRRFWCNYRVKFRVQLWLHFCIIKRSQIYWACPRWPLQVSSFEEENLVVPSAAAAAAALMISTIVLKWNLEEGFLGFNSHAAAAQAIVAYYAIMTNCLQFLSLSFFTRETRFVRLWRQIFLLCNFSDVHENWHFLSKTAVTTFWATSLKKFAAFYSHICSHCSLQSLSYNFLPL